MRKLWYAGAAVASGILLFAASPAQADSQPTPTSSDLLPGNSIAPPFGDLLSGAGGYALSQGNSTLSGAGSMATSGTGSTLTGANDAARQASDGLDRVRRPTNNIHLAVPLDGSRPLTQVQPGTNTPGLLPSKRSANGLPAADVIGPLQQGPLNGGGDGGGLLGGSLFDQFPLVGGLMPNGEQQPQPFDSFDRPTAGETESITDGMPLLGGMLPVNGLSSVPTLPSVPDTSGLPGGGMAVLAPAIAAHHKAKPAEAPTTAPAAAAPTTAPASAPAADPRLHEEPIDGERTFSTDGRPVAGVDQQFK